MLGEKIPLTDNVDPWVKMLLKDLDDIEDLKGSTKAEIEGSILRAAKGKTANLNKSLDPELFERLSKLCSKEHKDHGITLAAPKLTVATVELYNSISSRIVDMNDKAAVEAMIPVAIRELGERLKEAEAEPGTGKRLA